MLAALFLIALGMAGLYWGAEWFVGGASAIARGLRISAAIVGLTVVSLASSSPELISTLTMTFRGSTDMALGNILGSNIANIGLVLGLSALAWPLAISRATVRSGVPFALGGVVMLYVLALDGVLGQGDGVLLLAGFGGFLYLQFRAARRHRADAADEPVPELRPGRDVVRIAAGLVAMVLGARWLIGGARTIAEGFGLSEAFIGISLVAIGTSLPELATSGMAASKGEADLAIGNVLGSNVLNVLFVLGLVLVLAPLPVSAPMLRLHFPAVLVFSVALLLLLVVPRLGRLPAGALAGLYVLYIAYAYRSGTGP